MKINNLSKSFGKKNVFKDLSLNIQDNKITYIMGESGCGKTTFLRILAGLDDKYDGTVDTLSGKISYVFQEPRLFPNLSVSKNISIIANQEKLSIDDVLNIVELENEALNSPSSLSGGMKMRLSLARALYHNGDLYLMDEPFSALDQDMKNRIIPKVLNALKGKTVIIVSHDETEASKYADSIIRFNTLN